jgi:endonuclease/exonuclease/phosphatase family metal-dependent hydrolase
MSELKALQWNIGGGKILAEGQDPGRMSSYSADGIVEIIDVIGNAEPDIIALQETHPPIPWAIAKALGYGHWVNHEVSPSHIDPTQRLGHGLVTHLPITQDGLETLTYPTLPEGSDITPHDKGISTYKLRLEDGEILTSQNLHLFPFGHYGIGRQDSPEAEPILREVEALVGAHSGRRIVQGDFNLDTESLYPLLPGLFKAGLEEVVQDEATTPTGKHIDHVLFSGIIVINSVVVKNVLTDHYPVVTTFAI